MMYGKWMKNIKLDVTYVELERYEKFKKLGRFIIYGKQRKNQRI